MTSREYDGTRPTLTTRNRSRRRPRRPDDRSTAASSSWRTSPWRLRRFRAARAFRAAMTASSRFRICRAGMYGRVAYRYRPGKRTGWTPRHHAPSRAYREAVDRLARVEQRVLEGHLRLAREPADVAAIKASGVPGAILAFEGGDVLEGDPARVVEFHARGVRSIQLVHYRINELGDIQTEPPRHGGLTDAALQV